jgi:hypothetical protein
MTVQEWRREAETCRGYFTILTLKKNGQKRCSICGGPVNARQKRRTKLCRACSSREQGHFEGVLQELKGLPILIEDVKWHWIKKATVQLEE